MQSTDRLIGTWRWLLILLVVISGMLAMLPSSPGVGAFGESASRGGKGRSRGGAPTIHRTRPPRHYRSTPTPSRTDLGEVVGISIGGWFSLALREDGTLVSWGNNSYGSLGDGTTITRFTAKPVPGLGSVLGFSAGDAHGLAVTTDGKVCPGAGTSTGNSASVSPGTTSCHRSCQRARWRGAARSEIAATSVRSPTGPGPSSGTNLRSSLTRRHVVAPGPDGAVTFSAALKPLRRRYGDDPGELPRATWPFDRER